MSIIIDPFQVLIDLVPEQLVAGVFGLLFGLLEQEGGLLLLAEVVEDDGLVVEGGPPLITPKGGKIAPPSPLIPPRGGRLYTLVGSRVVCDAAVDERGVNRLVELIAGGGEEQAVVGLAFLVQSAVVDALQKVQDRVGVLLDEAVSELSLPPPRGGVGAGCQHEQQGDDAGRQQTGGYVVCHDNRRF